MALGRRLGETERRELKLRARREVGRVSERLHMVLLADRGFSLAQIATIYECGEATVRQWLGRFEAGGVEALRDLPTARLMKVDGWRDSRSERTSRPHRWGRWWRRRPRWRYGGRRRCGPGRVGGPA